MGKGSLRARGPTDLAGDQRLLHRLRQAGLCGELRGGKGRDACKREREREEGAALGSHRAGVVDCSSADSETSQPQPRPRV